MSATRHIRTVCRSCHGGCGVIAYVKNGKVIKVEGDPESPISYGNMCVKGPAITQLAYHPDRILYPMQKVNGEWKRLSLKRHPPKGQITGYTFFCAFTACGFRKRSKPDTFEDLRLPCTFQLK